MNKFKDTNFFVKFLFFIFLPSIILIYNALNRVIYNLSFSAEEIKGIVSATYIHPYFSAFMEVLGMIVSVALIFTSCFFEKVHKVRKTLFVFFAGLSFFIFIQNIIVWFFEIYNYFKISDEKTVIRIICFSVTVLLILVSSFLRCFLATKQVISSKISDKLILFVAIYLALMPFLNVFVSIINILEYDIPLINHYISYDKLIGYALNAYSGFCLIYFGFRNNSFIKGENVVE